MLGITHLMEMLEKCLQVKQEYKQNISACNRCVDGNRLQKQQEDNKEQAAPQEKLQISKKNEKISVLLATRQRKEMLDKSIDSLMTNISNTDNVEIMLGIDNDDQETLDIQNEDFQNKMQDDFNVDVQAVLFDRLGYKNLHEYMNAKCGHRQAVNG